MLFVMKQIKHTLAIISLLMLATQTPQALMGSKKTVQTSDTNLQATTEHSTDWINIWVHGTRLTPKVVFPHFFHVNQGLNKATDLDNSYHHRTIAQTLSDLDTKKFDLAHFYLFGWSGKLSFQKRKTAAKELYKALNTLVAEYTAQHGTRPKIRIITHSHGGNVALNLAQCATNHDFAIDELVLLACPVQEQTKQLIKHPFFKTIYSFYSTRDILQVIDPQGIYVDDLEDIDFEQGIFSARTFPEHEKLKQVEIRYNDRGILHVEFLLINKLASFVKHLPHALDQAALCKDSYQKISLH